jgi:hypothetical protein
LLLVMNVVDARGDAQFLEAQLRHYSDRWESGPDGSFVIRRAAHPILSFLALVVVSWGAAFLSGYAIERLRLRVINAG